MGKEFYVYIYYDPSRNTEPFYVGKGAGMRAEWHLRYPKPGRFGNRLKAMQSCGVVPIIDVWPQIDEAAAFAMEMHLIDLIGRKDLGLGPLCNMTNSGEGVSGASFNLSEEAKQKISRARLGVPKTAAHREKLSAANRNRPWSNARRDAQNKRKEKE